MVCDRSRPALVILAKRQVVLGATADLCCMTQMPALRVIPGKQMKVFETGLHLQRDRRDDRKLLKTAHAGA